MSCGEDGHFGRDCSASPEKVMAFKQSLAKTGKFEDRKHREEVKGVVAEISDRVMDGGLGCNNG